jgi:HPt (histidine-containing phosphotransfer) domain-containing protein
MDGLEATQRLRERERARGGHVPVIAMTAHALKGDRERCLEAGMDGYVSKPVRPEDLYAAIAALAPAEPGGPDLVAEETTGAPQLSAMVDWDAALSHVGGDVPLLREMAALFLRQAPGWMDDIGRAIPRGDADAVRAAAHPLRNSLKLFGANAAAQLGQELETQARRGELVNAPVALEALTAEVERLLPAMRAFAN